MQIDNHRLKEVLRNGVAKASREAVQEGRDVSVEEYEALTRLERLVEIQEKLAPTPTRNRWATAALLVVTLAVVSVLLFARVNRTEIELDAQLREVGLRVAADEILIEGAEVAGFAVAGASAISVRRAGKWPGLELADSNGEGLDLEITIGPEPLEGHITIAALEAKAGTRVWLRPSDKPGRFRLTLDGADREIRASLRGAVRIAARGAAAQVVEFPLPRPAIFQTGGSTVDLDVTLLDPGAISFSPQIAVNSLSLYEVRHSKGIDRTFSSLLSGAVYLEALNGRKLDLRSRQELRLKTPSGRIRGIQLEPGSAALQFHGFVEGMETGSQDYPRDLMPTYLEWLHSRHGLSLLWGTAIYIFGLVLAALRWFKVGI